MKDLESLFLELQHYDNKACSLLNKMGLPSDKIPYLIQLFLENPSNFQSHFVKNHPHIRSARLLVQYIAESREIREELCNLSCSLTAFAKSAFNLGMTIGMVAPAIGVEVLEWEKSRLERHAKHGKAFEEGRHAKKAGVLRECVQLAVDYYRDTHGRGPVFTELLRTLKFLHETELSAINKYIQEFDDEDESVLLVRKNGKECTAKYRRISDLLSEISPIRKNRSCR